ncbi:MAG: putative rane protein [Bacteroidetes bacterium]|nr:putative rane protein [Bacteroidota bacterium]
MKKVTSIFLLIAMLFIGAHPVVAMHFCGETLHSVAMTSKVDGCCAKDNAAEKQELAFSGQDCCKTHQVHYSTDNFSVDSSSFTLGHHLSPAFFVWCSEQFSSLSISVPSDRIDRRHFPPDGHPLQNSDILTYIRIFRI